MKFLVPTALLKIVLASSLHLLKETSFYINSSKNSED